MISGHERGPTCRTGHHRTFRCLNSARRNSRFACAGGRQDREFERVSRRLVLAAVGSSHLARREVAREALLDSHRFCGRSRPPDAPRLTLGLVRAGFFVCCYGNSRGTDSAKNLQKCYEWVRQTSVNPLISLVGAPRFELGTPSPPD